MSYCQGTVGTAEASAGVTRNMTECSHRTILSSFDPTQDWEVTHAAQLEWPRVISDDFHAFRTTTQSMAVLYCMGVGAMGAALIVKIWTAVTPRAGQGLFEFGFMVVSRHESTLGVCAVHPNTTDAFSCSLDLLVLVSHLSLRRLSRLNLWRWLTLTGRDRVCRRNMVRSYLA